MRTNYLVWKPYLNHEWNDFHPAKVKKKRLQDLAKRLSTIPAEIVMQPLVKKIYSDRLGNGEQ